MAGGETHPRRELAGGTGFHGLPVSIHDGLLGMRHGEPQSVIVRLGNAIDIVFRTAIALIWHRNKARRAKSKPLPAVQRKVSSLMHNGPRLGVRASSIGSPERAAEVDISKS